MKNQYQYLQLCQDLLYLHLMLFHQKDLFLANFLQMHQRKQWLNYSKLFRCLVVERIKLFRFPSVCEWISESKVSGSSACPSIRYTCDICPIIVETVSTTIITCTYSVLICILTSTSRFSEGFDPPSTS